MKKKEALIKIAESIADLGNDFNNIVHLLTYQNQVFGDILEEMRKINERAS